MNNIVNPKKPFITKKFMHPRNIYREKQDFTQMAIDYPEFRKIAKQDVKGDVTIDFKNDESLRVFNKTLLKKDFDLDVNIPPGFLVPTISLRLNYILWIEDILNIMVTSDTIRGIDIGTGASCVYMLMGAKKNNWHMIGTEIDAESVEYAQNNITSNHLEHLLQVVLTNDSDPLFKFLPNDDTQYDFCMCNPPFFDNIDQLSHRGRKNRPLPKNVQTGKHSELITEGGENAFICRMINESLELKTRVRIYTTMIGHKKYLPPLIELLKKVGITNYAQTEFYQGHTSRWGLAWTFCEDVKLEIVATELRFYDKEKRKSKSEKNTKRPLIYQFTNSSKYTKLDTLLDDLRNSFNELKFSYNQNEKTGHHIFDVTAYENTWIHQRQKRRSFQQIQKFEIVTYKLNADNKLEAHTTVSTASDQEIEILKSGKRPAKIELNSDISDAKKLKIDDHGQPEEPLLKFQMAVELINLNQYQFTLMYMGGTLKKDAMNQVLTYLKNKLC